jgi:D-Tyr-tRNAtyr deacylase
MQIEAAAAGTEEQTNVEPQVDPAAAALAEAAANAPASTEDALRSKAAAEAKAEAPARPEWLPEEFETPEAMAEAFAALKAGTNETPKVEGEGESEAKTEEEAKEVPAGFVDVKAVSAEWDEKGELSEATYADLAAKGYDKTIVDQYIAGQTALADAATRRLNEAAGGKENLERMFAWASTSLTADEINQYNASFANADVNAASLAIAQLKGKYEAANGREPKLLGGKPPASAADVFNSWAEVTKAMSDPRYRSDPAFNAKVQAKLARSNAI